jgi:hypothetical protein
MQLAAFIQDISTELGDQPDGGGPLSWQRWSAAQIAAVFHEGMCYIASDLRPNDFQQIVETTLAPGSAQRLDCCPKVVRVVEQIDALGNTIARLDNKAVRKSADRVAWGARWQRPGCAVVTDQAPTFTLAASWVENTGPSVFYVTPPVPVGVEVRVRVVCAGFAPAQMALTDDISACQFAGALRHYVLASLLSHEAESAEDTAASRDHFARFMAMVKYSNERDDKLKANQNA